MEGGRGGGGTVEGTSGICLGMAGGVGTVVESAS